MKKIIAGLLAIFILSASLAGCKDNSGDGVTGITRYTTDGKTTKMVADETLLGELNVDLGTFGIYSAQELERAKELYTELYPNVKLNIAKDNMDNKNYDFNAANKKMQTEIMSGKGPDIFVADYFLNDCYKQMRTGVYADLTEYFENDKSFNVSDFAETVLYSGQYQGKQYLVPAFFQKNNFVTTQSIIDEIGFDIKKCKNFLSLEEELLRVIKENKLGCDSKYILPGFATAYWFLNNINTTFIDYENNEVHLVGNEKIKKAFENTKSFLPYTDISTKSGKPFENSSSLDVTRFEALSQKKSMFIVANFDSLIYKVQLYRDLKATGEELVVIPINDFNGKSSSIVNFTIGVNANSKNIPAAYAFIKLLISNEFLEVKSDDSGNYYFPGMDNGSLPLNKRVFKEMALKQGSFGDRTFDVNAKIIPAYMLTEEDVNNMLDFYYDVEVCQFSTSVVYTIMDEMDAFILKDGSYEKAIESAQNYAEIYVSE